MAGTMGKPWEKEKEEKLKGKYKRQPPQGHRQLHLSSPAALENKGALYNHRLDVFQSLYTFYRLTYFE